MIDFILNIPPWVWIALVAHGVILGTVAYLILLERKVASWTQDRIGPNRVGPRGLLQPVADGLKMLLKEDYRPKNVDKILFSVAPITIMVVVVVSIAVLPWGGKKQTTKRFEIPATADVDAAVKDHIPGVAWVVTRQVENISPGPDYTGVEQPARKAVTVTYRYNFQIADLNVGVLFVLAVLSLAVYGIVLGGWASNNKYSFLGGLRATAQMISYEIPLGLAVLTIVVMFGTLDLAEIVGAQVGYWLGVVPKWNVFCQPLAFFMFLVCIHAEANRAPFDLAEAEQELVGGYHTEYSAMRMGLFFLAEYAGMITTSIVCATLFFGGWHIPWLDKVWPALSGLPGADGLIARGDTGVTTSLAICVLRALVLFGKGLFIIFVFMWVRWSLPRFRFDQLMHLAWAGMIPLTLAMLMVTSIVVYFFPGRDRIEMRVPGKMAVWLLAANVVLTVGTLLFSRVLPAARDTNRRIKVPGSRFTHTPLPAGTGEGGGRVVVVGPAAAEVARG